jgi:hypothetical protein
LILLCAGPKNKLADLDAQEIKMTDTEEKTTTLEVPRLLREMETPLLLEKLKNLKEEMHEIKTILYTRLSEGEESLLDEIKKEFPEYSQDYSPQDNKRPYLAENEVLSSLAKIGEKAVANKVVPFHNDNEDEKNSVHSSGIAVDESEKRITHKRLKKITKGRKRGTNWSIQIRGTSDILNTMIEYLKDHPDVKALKGNIIKADTNTESQIQALLKYKQQTSELIVLKVLKSCAGSHDITTENLNIDLAPVKNQQHLKQMIKNVLENTSTDSGTCFEKGFFVLPERNTEHITMNHAVNLIQNVGIARAGVQWAEMHYPKRYFDKAIVQINWEKNKKTEKQLLDRAEDILAHLRPWQTYVHNIYLSDPDPRTIYVVLDRKGNTGKTELQKTFAAVYQDSVLSIQNSSSENMMLLAKNAVGYKMVQVGLARQNSVKFNMEAIELLKDGLFSSMKYQSSLVRTVSPHLIIYTNTEPNWNKLTEDRWKIIHLDENYTDGYKVFDLTAWKKSMCEFLFHDNAVNDGWSY